MVRSVPSPFKSRRPMVTYCKRRANLSVNRSKHIGHIGDSYLCPGAQFTATTRSWPIGSRTAAMVAVMRTCTGDNIVAFIGAWREPLERKASLLEGLSALTSAAQKSTSACCVPQILAASCSRAFSGLISLEILDDLKRQLSTGAHRESSGIYKKLRSTSVIF
jgi:hypothetical protein